MTVNLPTPHSTQDTWGEALNAALTGLDERTANLETTSESVDARLADLEATATTLPDLADVATSGEAFDVAGATLEFLWDSGTSHYLLRGDSERTAAALARTDARKVFAGPGDDNSSPAVTEAGVIVLAYGDRWDVAS